MLCALKLGFDSSLQVAFIVCFSLWMSVLRVSGERYLHEEIPPFACGKLLDGDSGDIESPLFPEPYPPQVDCTWYIRVRPGHRIHLTSEYFYVEHQTQCLWDYLMVEDGERGEFGHVVFCGTKYLDFLSTSNVLTLTFHSDVSGNDAGFRIHYESITTQQSEPISCNITIRQEGTVTSPYYPMDYPANTVCFYKIQAPAGAQTVLEFTDFEVETFPCLFDKLEIFDGTTGILGTFCGRNVPTNMTSSGSVMTLKLTSDGSLESRGFNFSVEFVSTEASTTQPSETATDADGTHLGTGTATLQPSTYECNVTVTVAESNVSSPGFPEEYSHNTYCVTKLRSPVLSTFFLRFLNFSIEEGENCSFDSLSIIQVTNTTNTNHSSADHLIWKKCGPILKNPILTMEGYGLDLVFRSDKSVTDTGFLVHVLITPVVNGPRCPDVCQNGGTCTEILLTDGAVDWKCSCTQGFTGVLCDDSTRPSCDEIFCVNGGLCTENADGAVCVCPAGFAGEFCEHIRPNVERGSLYFTKMATNMSLSAGSSAILECAVNDDRASVMWLFHDRILTNTDRSSGVEVHPGGVVVIPEVRDEHSGRYTCMAVTADDLVERSVWIELTESCSLEVSKAPANITVREGQAAMFECHVPDADVLLWRKDGDLIMQGPRKRVLVNHYLVVNPVVETDSGQYTCVARGGNGCFSKSSAYLTVERTGHGRECGLPRIHPGPVTSSGSGRISSGRQAPEGSAPWHVVFREDRKDTTFCGGSLISRDTVLTAAHCVVQFEDTFGYPFHPRHIQIYLGTHHCEGHNGIFSGLKSYVIHEHFNNTYFNNDVAIFKLDTPVTFSDDVMPICLERMEFVDELLKPGRLGTITGCGDRYASGIPPTHLHQVQIPFVQREICQERAAAVNTTFSAGMFCAGYARSMRGDACSGDSGGPYVMQFSGRSIQVGIVSWGVGCDRENHYGYYTNVAYYYDWIMKHI